MNRGLEPALHERLVDTLYTEAMVLADEARAYFDEGGRADREALAPLARVSFSCESLKVTTRLMHIVAWLLTRRAVEAGELRPHEALDATRRLGDSPASEDAVVMGMPPAARQLVASSIDLHRRVARLDRSFADAVPASPVRSLQDRLALAF